MIQFMICFGLQYEMIYNNNKKILHVIIIDQKNEIFGIPFDYLYSTERLSIKHDY
jgi:hypothetical protein